MMFRRSRPAPKASLRPRAAQGDDGHVLGPHTSSQLVDLLPIPVAVLELDQDRFQFEAVNRPFREAGLGTSADTSPVVQMLGERVARFLASGETHDEFPWEFGDAIDARHFRVMLARRASSRRAPRCMISLVDHTPEHRTQTSLRREMQSDSLTGLPNRAGFSEVIEGADVANGQDGFAVMIVNLDRFSRVNACMGGLAGDELLISVARRIKGALRGCDTLARIGGDEFGILVRAEEGAGDALHVARRIEAALTTPFRLSDFEIRIDCSIGIALGTDEIDEPEDLIRHAQFAVKRAKKAGRTEVYNHSAFDIVRTQFGIETQLRRAIENGEMRLSFQPICDLASGRIVSFESLARWNEDGRDISPADFIPVAEECGLIVPLGRWAMHEAARTVSEWDAMAGGDCGASVAVNLSAIQLQRDRIAPMVREALESHKLSGTRLTIELTESALVTDPDRIAATMQGLKALGCTLALDDFGTGYSNLGYLQKLPIDILKIDRSFVSGMLADRDKVAIVRAILSLAQALNMRTTAEGIEAPELEQTLAALGCTHGQGYFYSRPLDAAAAYALLAERNA